MSRSGGVWRSRVVCRGAELASQRQRRSDRLGHAAGDRMVGKRSRSKDSSVQSTTVAGASVERVGQAFHQGPIEWISWGFPEIGERHRPADCGWPGQWGLRAGIRLPSAGRLGWERGERRRRGVVSSSARDVVRRRQVNQQGTEAGEGQSGVLLRAMHFTG